MTITKPEVELYGLYRPCEVVKLLGISKSTMYRLRAEGYLRFQHRRARTRPVTTGREILKCWSTMCGPMTL